MIHSTVWREYFPQETGSKKWWTEIWWGWSMLHYLFSRSLISRPASGQDDTIQSHWELKVKTREPSGINVIMNVFHFVHLPSWLQATYPLCINQHIHLEDNNIIYSDVFVSVQYVKSLAHCNAINQWGWKDEVTFWKQKQKPTLYISVISDKTLQINADNEVHIYMYVHVNLSICLSVCYSVMDINATAWHLCLSVYLSDSTKFSIHSKLTRDIL